MVVVDGLVLTVSLPGHKHVRHSVGLTFDDAAS
jgi:hypothetical protein